MDNFNKYISETAILTPSLVQSKQRYQFASDSYKSLRKALGNDISMFVLHHNPKRMKIIPELFRKYMPSLYWDKKVENIYAEKNTYLTRNHGRGSASGLRESIINAMNKNKKYGFIHLDDHVYCNNFRKLFLMGIDALNDDENLLWVRFSGYPIMCNNCPDYTRTGDQINFDTVTLNANRKPDYTIWHTKLDNKIIDGNYWPVAMWFTAYRLSFILKLLDWACESSVLHLAHVELYFREKHGFDRLREAYPDGKFGYINMQYGGIEMHRNKNWESLLKTPNEPIL